MVSVYLSLFFKEEEIECVCKLEVEWSELCYTMATVEFPAYVCSLGGM